MPLSALANIHPHARYHFKTICTKTAHPRCAACAVGCDGTARHGSQRVHGRLRGGAERRTAVCLLLPRGARRHPGCPACSLGRCRHSPRLRTRHQHHGGKLRVLRSGSTYHGAAGNGRPPGHTRFLCFPPRHRPRQLPAAARRLTRAASRFQGTTPLPYLISGQARLVTR